MRNQAKEWMKKAAEVIKAEENYCVHLEDEDHSKLAEVRLEIWKWVLKSSKCL